MVTSASSTISSARRKVSSALYPTFVVTGELSVEVKPAIPRSVRAAHYRVPLTTANHIHGSPDVQVAQPLPNRVRCSRKMDWFAPRDDLIFSSGMGEARSFSSTRSRW